MKESGAAAGPSADSATTLPASHEAARPTETCCEMGELAEASGVPVPTIKHYLREGLLPEPVKTSRNMAYYPPEFVDRIKLIKQLQEERFMPLKAIKAVLDEDPERARALVELEDRILERALAGERTRTSAAEVRERYGVPKEVLDRLERARGAQPQQPRLLALRREDHRGDQPLPRRRLRRADRLHRLRHPALQEARSKSWSARRSRW